MTTAAFLSRLRELDVRIWADGDRLRCNAPPGVLTPALQEQLSRRKAELLVMLQEAANGAAAPPLTRIERTGDLPLSFAQERFWFLQQLEPHSTAYNMPLALMLKGVLDVDALAESWRLLIQRHESFRTRFRSIDGRPVQTIAPDWEGRVERIDLEGPDVDAARAEAVRLATEEARRPFNLSIGPLVRVSVFRIEPREHLMFVNIHHIASDLWSHELVLRELGICYRALQEGREPQLPELPVRYADYAAWQRRWLDGNVVRGQLAYWRKALAGMTPLDLAGDRTPPIGHGSRSAHVVRYLPHSTFERLKSVSLRNGVTLSMTLLAALLVLLRRYTGKEDIAVGAPVANRRHSSIEGVVGVFINTLVLRTDVSGRPTLRELLKRVRDVTLDAYARQDVPFERLVAELHPARDISRFPLVQVMFNVLTAPNREVSVGGIQAKEVVLNRGHAQIDLSLTIQPAGTQGLSLEFDAERFDPATIERMLDHYERVFEALMGDLDVPVDMIDLLTPEARTQALTTWQGTSVSNPPLGMHELFETQVEKTPDAVAVVSGAARVSYHELNARANQLAHRLRGMGVGPDVLVGVGMERSLNMLVALLAVAKAGGAYVPLDPAFPQQRLDWMLEDADVNVLITQSSLADMWTASPAPLVVVDAPDADVDSESRDNLPSVSSPANLAYVIFTSGSTGRPKGVQVRQQGLTNFLLSMHRTPGIESHDRLLAVTTLSFDIAGLELFLPLTVGATVLLASRTDGADGRRLIQLLEEHRATIMQATPATWRLMIEAGWTGTADLKVLCGGEALSRELADELLDRAGDVWNMYGPTETTIWSSLDRVDRSGPIVIGRPIANTKIYVVDASGGLLPAGVSGEICIGGDGIARGYLKRPDLTADRFALDPFSGISGARMYRTGDLGRFRADGRLECLGRIDNQVKIRGFRIELGEIESALRQIPAIQDAVVVACEDSTGEKRLVAYAIVDAPPAPSVSDLRAALSDRLPDYMIPSLYRFVAQFPLTPNGKVDRQALPAPDSQRPETGASYVLPRNAMEEAIAAIWKDVLGVERVGIKDSFFELGGHSLLLMKVHSRLCTQLNRNDVSVIELFRYPTIEALAQRLTKGAENRRTFQRAKERAGRQQAALDSRPAVFAGQVHQ